MMCNPTTERSIVREVAAERERLATLDNERAELTTAMMLLGQNTRDSRRRLVEINAEIHLAEGRLKFLQ